MATMSKPAALFSPRKAFNRNSLSSPSVRVSLKTPWSLMDEARWKLGIDDLSLRTKVSGMFKESYCTEDLLESKHGLGESSL